MRSTNLIPVDFGIAIARKWNGKRSEVKEYVKACSFVVLTSSFIFLLVQRKSEKLCVIVDRKKKAKISWVCSHCWLRQRCELSSTFSFFLANRGIVHNIEIYDLLLGWYSYGSSKLFLFHTSRLFFFLLQFVFYILHGSSCAYFTSFCAFLSSILHIFFILILIILSLFD